MAAFHAAEAGAAPAWSANVSKLPKCKSLHAALRRRRFGVRVLAGALPQQREAHTAWRPRPQSSRERHFPNVDHVVTVSIPPCEGGGTGASPVGQPGFRIAHTVKRRTAGPQNRQTRCESGMRVFISNSPVAQVARASGFDPEGDGASPSGAAISTSRRSPMQRQRAQTSSSAGASPAAGTMEREPAERAGFPC